MSKLWVLSEADATVAEIEAVERRIDALRAYRESLSLKLKALDKVAQKEGNK